MENKKIAIVANSTWNIYNFRQDFIRSLKEKGYRVIVIAPVDEYIHYLNESYFTKHIPLKHLQAQSTNIFRDILLFFELLNIYKREKPDLIFQFTIKPNIYGSLAARMLNIACISTLTGLGYTFIHSNFRSYLVKKLYKLALRKNKFAVFHNRDDQNLFIDNKLIGKNQAIHIPGSGVDTDKFKRYPKESHDNFTFIFIGRLLKEKGLLEFIQASIEVKSIVKNVNFWVLGQWNESNPGSIDKDEWLYWIEKRQIKYFGAEKDVRHYLNQADALVLPSYREGVPRAVLEAMAMELPVITCDTPGCRDTIMEGKNGFLVPIKDSHALAKAMVDLYNMSADSLLKMGQTSRSLVLDQFDIKLINGKYATLINSVFESEKVIFVDLPKRT